MWQVLLPPLQPWTTRTWYDIIVGDLSRLHDPMVFVGVGFRAGVYTTVLIIIFGYIFGYFDLGRSRDWQFLNPVELCD